MLSSQTFGLCCRILMKVNAKQSNVKLSYRDASLLDVPFIFDLMMDGAMNGSFSDAFIERKGSPQLLWAIFTGIISQKFLSKSSPMQFRWQLVLDITGNEVGFLKTSIHTLEAVCHLELLAIVQKRRNLGIGTSVVRDITSKLPNQAQLRVHCTKFSRAMQHILKRNDFSRTHQVLQGYSVEEYISNRVPL